MGNASRAGGKSKTGRFVADHVLFFRLLAAVGTLFAIYMIWHPWNYSTSSATDAAIAQSLGAALAGVALLVAVWAVNVTQNVANEIKISGENSDVIAASTVIQSQWQVLNLELIRDPKKRVEWEPNEPTPDDIPRFEHRLAISFYIMQILKLHMLYSSKGIQTSLNDASKHFWSYHLMVIDKPIWDWIVERKRGFSEDDMKTVKLWARIHRDSLPI